MSTPENSANGVAAIMRKKADNANRKALFEDTDPATLEVIRNNAATTLKAIRKRLVLTQPQLANRMKVSFSSINHWEMRITLPRDEALLKISGLAKECGVPLIPLHTEQVPHDDDDRVIRPLPKQKGPKGKKLRKGSMTPQEALAFLEAFSKTDIGKEHFEHPVAVVVDYVTRLENALEAVQRLYEK